jgi:hypothetical protein
MALEHRLARDSNIASRENGALPFTPLKRRGNGRRVCSISMASLDRTVSRDVTAVTTLTIAPLS